MYLSCYLIGNHSDFPTSSTIKILIKLGCVVRMVVDSILLHTESRPNDHLKDAPPLIQKYRIIDDHDDLGFVIICYIYNEKLPEHRKRIFSTFPTCLSNSVFVSHNENVTDLNPRHFFASSISGSPGSTHALAVFLWPRLLKLPDDIFISG